ncbi:hypothetical protein [Erythrobacter neustonensis]|uniref:hypothetical protein n=1 Tax=Erythrobacter neustonensis TaxID=1112 RepID=UPI0012E9243A|nr:hypothetical protein [Erythrobacter neustonensis]
MNTVKLLPRSQAPDQMTGLRHLLNLMDATSLRLLPAPAKFAKEADIQAVRTKIARRVHRVPSKRRTGPIDNYSGQRDKCKDTDG